MPNEGGFALGLVVLLLFAIAVAGATGYQVVRSEYAQAQGAAETGLAMTVAEGGLQWFLGTQRGTVPDTMTYSINGGTAVVTTRKVATLSADEDLYLVTSQGTYSDPRYPQIPAVRTVSQYAEYKKVPLNTLAPLITTSQRIRIRTNTNVNGNDHAYAGQCAGAPAAAVAGAVATSTVQVQSGGTLVGSPTDLTLGSGVVDAVGMAWDVFSDPTFPVDNDGTWPNFASIPSDSFPVIRVNGDFSPNWTRSGRGVLIITGALRIPTWSFWNWTGLVVAGSIGNVGRWNYFTVQGALVGGLGTPMDRLDLDNGNIDYHSCYVSWAGASLRHLSAMGNSWWEER
ncbi:hypothetical protein ACFL5A_02055 [Gemmatimonadota bacterium]